MERERIEEAVYFFGLVRVLKLRLQAALGLHAIFPTLDALRASGPAVRSAEEGPDAPTDALRRAVETKSRHARRAGT